MSEQLALAIVAGIGLVAGITAGSHTREKPSFVLSLVILAVAVGLGIFWLPMKEQYLVAGFAGAPYLVGLFIGLVRSGRRERRKQR